MWHVDLVAPWHVGSSPARDPPVSPASGRFFTTEPPWKPTQWFDTCLPRDSYCFPVCLILCLEKLGLVFCLLRHAGYDSCVCKQLNCKAGGRKNMSRQKCGLHLICSYCPTDHCQLGGGVGCYHLKILCITEIIKFPCPLH